MKLTKRIEYGFVSRVDLKFNIKCQSTNQHMTLIIPFNRRGLILVDSVYDDMDASTFIMLGKNIKSYRGLSLSKGGMWEHVFTTMSKNLAGQLGAESHPFFRAVCDLYLAT